MYSFRDRLHLTEMLDAPDLPWRLMVGMRNRLAHSYFRADRHIIWETAAVKAPLTRNRLEELLAQTSED